MRMNDILNYFNPPPGRSTFYDWRSKGLIVPASTSKELKGYYKLNASLKRLGLPIQDVKAWREAHVRIKGNERQRSLVFTALAILVEELMLCPADEFSSGLSEKEMEVVRKVYSAHKVFLDPTVEPFEEGGLTYPLQDVRERLAYAGAVLDTFDLENYGRIRGA